MKKIYRKGAVGALLDVYEEAIASLKQTIKVIPDNVLPVVLYPETEDENCRSIQSILSHVVHAGYGYATSISNLDGSNTTRPGKTIYMTTKAWLEALDNLFVFTEDVFRHINDNELEQFESSNKIKTGWGQLYDIEQMTEHAIVHILRHKRQIEKICSERLGSLLP